MKSASLPSLRVDPELRQSAEAVLRKGESLSSFMEQSLRDEVSRRRLHAEFIARGIDARDDAKRAGEYFEASAVHAKLRTMLAKAKALGGIENEIGYRDGYFHTDATTV